MLSYILALVCGGCLLIADQFTKYYIITNFTLGESTEFINGFIDITYIHNSGGAWGMLSGNTWLLLSFTVVVMLVCVTLLLSKGVKDKLLFWSLTLVLFGGIGNMIDRIFRGGEVVDFLHFEFYPQFPVFNVADIGIVMGSGLLVLYFIIDTVREAKLKKKAETQTAGQNGEN